MKIKVFFTMLLACTLMATAQSQGFKDGIEYYKAGQYENAKTILTRTINDAATDKALAQYYLGQTYLALGDKAAAKQCFDAGIAADPNNPYNYVGQGALELLNGNANAAEDLFKTAQKLGKKNYEILVNIARAYYNADPVLYAKEVEKFLAKAHKDSKHEEPSIYILEGDMLFDKGDFGAAAGKYEMAIRYDNANPEGYVKYANSYFRVAPQYALQKLEDFLRIAPESALAQRELAEKYYEANYWNKAAEQYGLYIQNPNHFPEDKARYAVLLYYGKDYTASLNTALEVLSVNPQNFLMQRLRFINEATLEQYDNAIRDAEHFFNSNPNGYFTSNDYIIYAGCFSALGNDSVAIEKFELASTKFPEDPTIYSNLSDLYNKDKQFTKAAEAFEKYIDNTENPELGDYMTGSGRWLNVAATAGEDEALRQTAAQKGLNYINEVIARALPNPFVIQRKARLIIAGNGSKPNAESTAVYNEMIAMLDQDPANADPANPDNKLALYREAYMFAISFYTSIEPDEELAAKYNELYKEVNEKLGL